MTADDGANSIPAVARQAFEQNVMQVDAVNVDVGMLEALLDIGAGIDAHNFLAAIGIEPYRCRRKMRLALDRIADAEPVEHVKDVRAELNAVADGAEFLRLLEYADAHALAAERQRGRQSAKPAADNQDGIIFRHRSPQLSADSFQRTMDCRVKSGNDGCYAHADPLDFPFQIDAGIFLDAAAHGFAERFDIGRASRHRD